MHPSIDDNNMEIITHRTKMLLIAQDDIQRDIISEIKGWLALVGLFVPGLLQLHPIRIPTI